MSRTLVVTNDFPPSAGGIQSYVHGMARRQPQGSIVVFASKWAGAAQFDAALGFPVHRYRSSMMLPTPDVASRAASIAREYGCTSVWFGAMAPLAKIAPSLRRRSGIVRAVASTHGHEVGWAAIPGARGALRSMARGLDVVTYLGEYTRSRLAPVVGDRVELRHLPGGVDVDTFHPGVDGFPLRARLGLADRPVVVCVSRLMARKGQDALIRALPNIQRRVPDAALLIVGGGPYKAELERMVTDLGLTRDVVLTGMVPWEALPEYYRAGDVFAMPCRTRRGGLDVEGLGLVYLEASACGLPVVAGDSGGAPDAVIDGTTGLVVSGRSDAQIAAAVTDLLSDADLASGMGIAGRAWAEREWRWETLAARLSSMFLSSAA